MKTYNHTRDALIGLGYNPETIEIIADKNTYSESLEEADKQFLSFEDEANKLPWTQDHDFGALVLQHKAMSTANSEIKKHMLNKAIERAKWCAACATSGGEALARAKHMNELQQESYNSFEKGWQ
ncbi:MAG: hypothetical protein D6B27_10660 [Gammaproteobacteria bacterium]|nr:MAG: hypothetical protein D6B27_10660 [Gammaproteobacteria bacterium]